MKLLRALWVVGAGLASVWPAAGTAANLFEPNKTVSIVADRAAAQIGDSLTILILESSTATNSARSGSARASRIDAGLRAGTTINQNVQASLGGKFDTSGETDRSGKMVAQISAVVDGILPNGDLHVSGEQTLRINGEHTKIKVRGRVRRVDISAANTIISSRLADAAIDYDGTGFVSKSARPGWVARLFNFLGL